MIEAGIGQKYPTCLKFLEAGALLYPVYGDFGFVHPSDHGTPVQQYIYAEDRPVSHHAEAGSAIGGMRRRLYVKS